ncbi:hypothetical protein QYF61_010031 [Mycteria americana]|uniref:Uncharacterized protein n=1 Tax=Mycteria americana TaxID=33587 RepID=A0AAN7RZD5_MYCAM|nr:hypothetical protein QYF61_010031 [Mycteria americana]
MCSIIVWGNTGEDVSEKGNKIVQILLKAGFAIKHSKVKGPAQEMQFLGIKWQDGCRQIPMDVINKTAILQHTEERYPHKFEGDTTLENKMVLQRLCHVCTTRDLADITKDLCPDGEVAGAKEYMALDICQRIEKPEEWASSREEDRRGKEEALKLVLKCPGKQAASEQGPKPCTRGRAQMEELVTKGPNRFEREEVKVLLEEAEVLGRTEKAEAKA